MRPPIRSRSESPRSITTYILTQNRFRWIHQAHINTTSRHFVTRDCLRFLEKHCFDILLHGHKHKAQLWETWVPDGMIPTDAEKSLIVCGTVSCGVNSLEHSIPNQYQVIELLSDSRIPRTEFLKVEWREMAVASEAEWTTRRVWTVHG